MGIREINGRIARTEACVRLHRGKGYHYYEFDNTASDAAGFPTDPPEYHFGDRLIYETESVMVPYLKHMPEDQWVADGIDFGRRVRERHGFGPPPARGMQKRRGR